MRNKSLLFQGAVHVAAAGALVGAYGASVATAPYVGAHNHRACSASWCTPGSPDEPLTTAKRWTEESVNKVAQGHNCVSPDQFPKGKFPAALIVHSTRTPAQKKAGTVMDTISARRVSFDEGFKAAAHGQAWIDKACFD